MHRIHSFIQIATQRLFGRDSIFTILLVGACFVIGTTFSHAQSQELLESKKTELTFLKKHIPELHEEVLLILMNNPEEVLGNKNSEYAEWVYDNVDDPNVLLIVANLMRDGIEAGREKAIKEAMKDAPDHIIDEMPEELKEMLKDIIR